MSQAKPQPLTFYCVDCRQTKPRNPPLGGTGYTTIFDDNKPSSLQKGRVCYDCCAYRDMADMIDTGKAMLYLHLEKRDWPIQSRWIPTQVANWPGTLCFPLRCQTAGKHNIARVRYDVWFSGPDDFVWWGVTYGDNTQICHCKRTKERSQL